jgi:UDP-N-acetylmuramate dehydrogenase
MSGQPGSDSSHRPARTALSAREQEVIPLEEARVSGQLSIEVLRERPLAPLATWQIGGPAAYYVEPTSATELAEALRYAEERRLPVLALGGASNMLISDRGFPGLVIRYLEESVETLRRGDMLDVRVGAGHLFSKLARGMTREGWSGLEWAEGIPGTVGGAIAGNAGAFRGQIADVVTAVRSINSAGVIRDCSGEECGFGYRTSIFKQRGLSAGYIVSATLLLRSGDPVELTRRMQEIAATRKRNSPTGSSCGSVFKNPPGDFAGRLVQAAGLLGAEEGAAQISTKHGNYIVNRGGATADQVLRLIQRARHEVHARFGVELELEVRLVGFDPSAGNS